LALVLRTNGAPLSGALFVSNPKRRKRNGLALTSNRRKRMNGLAMSANRKRRNAGEYLFNVHGNRSRKRRNTVLWNIHGNRKRRNAGEYLFNVHGNRSRKRRNTGGYLFNVHGNRKARRNTGGYLFNVHGNRRGVVRRNAALAFTNQLTTPVENLVKKVPYVGATASGYVAPILMGVVVGGVHYGALSLLQNIPYVKQVVSYANPVKYTLGGVVVATVLKYLPVGSADLRGQVGVAALLVGGALDAFRFLSRQAGDLGDADLDGDDDMAGLAMSATGMEYQGLAMSATGSEMGDGLAYDVVPFDGVAMDYNGASLGDAAAAPADLSVEEGDAAVRGAGAWQARFGAPPIVRVRNADGFSAYAGRPGHRFGWLIQLIGFDRFQKLAMLPPEARVALIAQLKSQAVTLADQRLASQRPQAGSLSGLAMSATGMEYHGLAMSAAGSEMSGLAMSDMNGLGSLLSAGSAF
jgi:hypothetical protein